MKGASDILTQNYVTPRGRGFEKVNENGDSEVLDREDKMWTWGEGVKKAENGWTLYTAP